MGHTSACRSCDLPVYQWFLQSTPPSLIAGWQKPLGLRTKGCINELGDRNVSGTRPPIKRAAHIVELLPFHLSPNIPEREAEPRKTPNIQEKGAPKSALSLDLRSGFLVETWPYSVIFDTTPAPTVRPPSRIAKRRPASIAIGAISSTSNFRLSPGITISVPSGRVTVPVTSVVRK